MLRSEVIQAPWKISSEVYYIFESNKEVTLTSTWDKRLFSLGNKVLIWLSTNNLNKQRYAASGFASVALVTGTRSLMLEKLFRLLFRLERLPSCVIGPSYLLFLFLSKSILFPGRLLLCAWYTLYLATRLFIDFFRKIRRLKRNKSYTARKSRKLSFTHIPCWPTDLGYFSFSRRFVFIAFSYTQQRLAVAWNRKKKQKRRNLTGIPNSSISEMEHSNYALQFSKNSFNSIFR